MGRSQYKIYEEGYPYFITSSVVNWEPIFREEVLVDIILDAFSFLQNHREVKVYAYVVMVRLFKSYTARKIIDNFKSSKEYELLNRFVRSTEGTFNQSEFQLWQKGFHPKQIIGDKMMLQKIEYIHQNPVRARYVNKKEDWKYSSIHNYLEQQAPISITCYRR